MFNFSFFEFSQSIRDDRIYSDSIQIRIFFLESRIFEFGFDNFGDQIIFEYSNLFPRILNIWNIFFLCNFEFKLGILTQKKGPADLLIPIAGTDGQDLCLDVTVTAALKVAFWICFLNSCFLLFIFHILFKYNWIIRIIFKYSNLFRDSNIFESFLKSWIRFGFENFLIYE